jgi:aldose 1-epimerase
MKVTSTSTHLEEGKELNSFTLHNGSMEVELANYGGTITAIRLPVAGSMRNVVLAYNSIEDYLSDEYFMGCIVGRFANRIRDAKFSISGVEYPLSMNEPANGNHLHGGFEGFGKKWLSLKNVRETEREVSVTLEYISSHLEEGYPGTFQLEVTYSLNSLNELGIRFRGVSDRDTHVNLTQHMYFNLNAAGSSDTDHLLGVDSNYYLESDDRFLPTGKKIEVEGSQYDFRKPGRVHEEVNAPVPRMNTYFILEPGAKMPVTLSAAGGKVQVRVSTSYPGILIYTGDYLGEPFRPHGGICLEAQFPPDSPNIHLLPSSRLEAGESYDHYIRYLFEWPQ